LVFIELNGIGVVSEIPERLAIFLCEELISEKQQANEN
jgi:hypothetical protein